MTHERADALPYHSYHGDRTESWSLAVQVQDTTASRGVSGWVHGQGAHLNKVSELVHEAAALAPGHSGPGSLVKGLHMHPVSEAAFG